MKNGGFKIFAPFLLFRRFSTDRRSLKIVALHGIFVFDDFEIFAKNWEKESSTSRTSLHYFFQVKVTYNTTLGCNYMFQVQWVDFSYLTIYYTLNNSFAPTDVIHLLKTYPSLNKMKCTSLSTYICKKFIMKRSFFLLSSFAWSSWNCKG